MEPGIIALAVIISIGAILTLAAVGTHVYEWRYLWLKKQRKAQEDLEKSALSSQEKRGTFSPKSPGYLQQCQGVPKAAAAGHKTDLKGSPQTGFTMMTSPASVQPVLSPISSTGDILHITSPKTTPHPSMMYSPTTPQSAAVPITPLTPAVCSPRSPSPLLNRPSDDRARFYDSRPLLLPANYATYASGEDRYTMLAPRVLGSRVRRFATPPRQLRLSIPAQESNFTTRISSRTHRRIPSSPKITAPPRILAHSVTELVGVPEEHDETMSEAREMHEENVRRTDKSLNQVGTLGW